MFFGWFFSWIPQTGAGFFNLQTGLWSSKPGCTPALAAAEGTGLLGEVWIAVAFLRESVLLHCILAGRNGSLTADKADTATVHREQCILGNGIQVRKWEMVQKSIRRGDSSCVTEVAPLSIINNFKGKAAKYNKDKQLMFIIQFQKVFSSTERALLMHSQITCWMDVSCTLIFSQENKNTLKILSSSSISSGIFLCSLIED